MTVITMFLTGVWFFADSSCTVYQTCVKYCSQAERDIIFEALRCHFLTLSRKKYAVHLVKKLLDTGMPHKLRVDILNDKVFWNYFFPFSCFLICMKFLPVLFCSNKKTVGMVYLFSPWACFFSPSTYSRICRHVINPWELFNLSNLVDTVFWYYHYVSA